MRLAPEAAVDLLHELTAAFGDPLYQRQIYKLAHDVRMEKRAFLDNLKQVALPLQRPVIEKYGFSPTKEGVQEMKRAIADYTQGLGLNERVKACADETTMAMYGCMYDVVTLPEPG